MLRPSGCRVGQALHHTFSHTFSLMLSLHATVSHPSSAASISWHPLAPQEHADGWEAFPSAALTSEQYATDLRSHKVSSTSSTGHTPYMALPPSTRGAGAGGGWGAGTGSALLHAPSAPPLLGAAGGEGGFHEVLEMAPLPWLPDRWGCCCMVPRWHAHWASHESLFDGVAQPAVFDASKVRCTAPLLDWLVRPVY